MPFITIPTTPREYQYSFDDILFGIKKSVFESHRNQQGNTRTVFREVTPSRLLEFNDFPKMLSVLVDFNKKHENLINMKNKATLYESFKIKKKGGGGLRQIDAPLDELKCALRELKDILETTFHATNHTTAFAYIKGRSTLDAVKRHQSNNSKWFLKLDFKNFFGSTTLDFVMRQLEHIFPFNEVLKLQCAKEEFQKALSLGFLNDGLPQGTPLSPILTNIMMIPIDHHIATIMRKQTPHIVYTRYADDLLLSADVSFKFRGIESLVMDILKNYDAPFTLKAEKTRYASSSGRNWNLGVMLNKDNQITIGHQKKKHFKAMLFSLHTDYEKGVVWSMSDARELQGLISYYSNVESEQIKKIIDGYDKKFNRKTKDIIKNTLRGLIPRKQQPKTAYAA